MTKPLEHLRSDWDSLAQIQNLTDALNLVIHHLNELEETVDSLQSRNDEEDRTKLWTPSEEQPHD